MNPLSIFVELPLFGFIGLCTEFPSASPTNIELSFHRNGKQWNAINHRPGSKQSDPVNSKRMVSLRHQRTAGKSTEHTHIEHQHAKFRAEFFWLVAAVANSVVTNKERGVELIIRVYVHGACFLLVARDLPIRIR